MLQRASTLIIGDTSLNLPLGGNAHIVIHLKDFLICITVYSSSNVRLTYWLLSNVSSNNITV